MLHGKEWIGFILGLLASIIFASFYIVGRLVFGQYDADPVVFTFIRFALAAPVFALYAVCRGGGRQLGAALTRSFWPMLGLALSGIVGEGLLLMASLKYTTAARSSLFANTSPILTVLLAFAFVREPMGRKQWFGMLLGFVGILAAIFSRSRGDLFMAGSSWAGDLLALASAFCWAVFTVLGRRLADVSGGVVSGAAAMIIGSILLMLLSFFFPYPWRYFGDWRFWAYAFYAGLIVSGLANILWIVALQYLEAGRLGAMGYISCILAMAGSFFCLREQMDAWFVAGAACVFLGVYWMMRRGRTAGKV